MSISAYVSIDVLFKILISLSEVGLETLLDAARGPAVPVDGSRGSAGSAAQTGPRGWHENTVRFCTFHFSSVFFSLSFHFRLLEKFGARHWVSDVKLRMESELDVQIQVQGKLNEC